MKTKLKILGVAAIAVAAGLVSISESRTTGQTPLTIANVEALSQGEVEGYMYVTPIEYSWGWGCNCAGKGQLKCCG